MQFSKIQSKKLLCNLINKCKVNIPVPFNMDNILHYYYNLPPIRGNFKIRKFLFLHPIQRHQNSQLKTHHFNAGLFDKYYIDQ